MTIMVAALALWCTLLIAPDTPIARAIRGWTVVRPAARLNRVTRGQVLLVLLLVSGASLIVWLMGHEAVRMMAMSLPELATWITMFEVTAYLDALAAIVAAASTARFGAVRLWLGTVLRRRPATPRARRTKPGVRIAANDAEDGRGLALAA